MKQNKRYMEQLKDAADLPGEATPGQPLIEILGQHRVLIEHHRGVTQYSREMISIRVKFGQICIKGQKLEMARMSAAQLIITGCICAIELSGRD